MSLLNSFDYFPIEDRVTKANNKTCQSAEIQNQNKEVEAAQRFSNAVGFRKKQVYKMQF